MEYKLTIKRAYLRQKDIAMFSMKQKYNLSYKIYSIRYKPSNIDLYAILVSKRGWKKDIIEHKLRGLGSFVFITFFSQCFSYMGIWYNLSNCIRLFKIGA